MLTYLVFMRLTIYTQKKKLNFKHLQVFKGYKVFIPVFFILVSLFVYPFAALAIFLLLFMTEILAQMWLMCRKKKEPPGVRLPAG